MKKLFRSKKIRRIKEAGVNTILIEKHILFYLAAATTMIAGVLHLAMIGPSLKPINFPMELLPYRWVIPYIWNSTNLLGLTNGFKME
jgi:hypothetical protein